MSRESISHCINCSKQLSEIAVEMELYYCPFCGYDLARQASSSEMKDDDEHGEESQHLDSDTQDAVGDVDPPIDIIHGQDSTGDQFLLVDEGDWDFEGYENYEEEDYDEDHDDHENETGDDGEIDDGKHVKKTKISQYATDLSHRTTSACTMSAIKKVYQVYHDILSDLPYYQSYNAIGRLLDRGRHHDHIMDVHALRIIWSENEVLWGERGNKYSLSWKLASDLLDEIGLQELESYMLNEWYDEWLATPRWGKTTGTGWQPGFNSYIQFLDHKCSLIKNTKLGW